MTDTVLALTADGCQSLLLCWVRCKVPDLLTMQV